MLSDVLKCIITGVSGSGSNAISGIIRNHENMDSFYEGGFLTETSPINVKNNKLIFNKFISNWQGEHEEDLDKIFTSTTWEEMYLNARKLSLSIKKKDAFLFDKSPLYTTCLKEVLLKDNKIKAIFIIRDPRDVYLTWKKQGLKIEEFIQIYNNSIWNLNIALADTVLKTRIKVVSYEDCVLNPYYTFSRLFAFLNLDFHEDLLEKNLKYLNDSRFSINYINRYKSNLNKNEIKLLRECISKECFYKFNTTSILQMKLQQGITGFSMQMLSAFWQFSATCLLRPLINVLIRLLNVLNSMFTVSYVLPLNCNLKGINTIDLAKMVQENYPALNINFKDLKYIFLFDKTKFGFGLATLKSEEGLFPLVKKVKGEPERFENNAPRTFYRIIFKNNNKLTYTKMEFNGNHKIKSMKLLFKREQKTRLQRLLFIITRKLMSLQNEADPVQNTNYYGSGILNKVELFIKYRIITPLLIFKKPYLYDSSAIVSILSPEEEFKLSQNKPICQIPWTGRSIIKTDGTLQPCCNAFQSVGKIIDGEEISFFEVWNSKQMQSVREKLLRGEFPDVCRSKSCSLYNEYILRVLSKKKQVGWVDEYNEYLANKKLPFQSICYTPFIGLFFRPGGKVVPCCWTFNAPIGDLTKETLTEVWTGKKVKELRESFLNYKFKPDCAHCVKIFTAKKHFSESPSQYYTSYVSEQEPKYPSRLEFHLSGRCNMDCIMCGVDVYSRDEKSGKLLEPSQYGYDDNFVKQLEEFFPHLKQISFGGGEPLLEEINYKILDRIIEHDFAKEIFLTITTNGSIVNDDVFKRLDRFKDVRLNISIDGYSKEVFESIRRGVSYEKIYKNLYKAANYLKTMPRITGSLSITPIQQNWRELPDLFSLAASINFKTIINYCNWPLDCTLYNLPQDKLIEIIEYLKKQSVVKSWRDDVLLMKEYVKFIDSLRSLVK